MFNRLPMRSDRDRGSQMHREVRGGNMQQVFSSGPYFYGSDELRQELASANFAAPRLPWGEENELVRATFAAQDEFLASIEREEWAYDPKARVVCPAKALEALEKFQTALRAVWDARPQIMEKATFASSKEALVYFAGAAGAFGGWAPAALLSIIGMLSTIKDEYVGDDADAFESPGRLTALCNAANLIAEARNPRYRQTATQPIGLRDNQANLSPVRGNCIVSSYGGGRTTVELWQGGEKGWLVTIIAAEDPGVRDSVAQRHAAGMAAVAATKSLAR